MKSSSSYSAALYILKKNCSNFLKKSFFKRNIYFLFIFSSMLLMASSCKPSVKKYTENARQLMLEGKFEEAIPILNTAIKKNSSSHEAYNLRGAAYLELDKFEKAKKDLDKAIKLHKKDYRYFYNKGRENTGRI